MLFRLPAVMTGHAVCRWRRRDGRQIVCCNFTYFTFPQNVIDPSETSFGILQHLLSQSRG